MAQETTTVQFRRGTTAENDEFTGAEGEVVVDTDLHTLRVHDEEKQGGYEIALASMINVDVATLAERDGISLAYNDLHNLISNTDPTSCTQVGSILTTDYKLAYNTMSNVNTSSLVQGGAHQGKDLAYADMSNMDTYNLANSTGHSGDNLAYANMSNVSTVDLATSTGHAGDNLAYANARNINTDELASSAHAVGSPLAYADGSNLGDAIEKTNRKDIEITEKSAEDYHYPTVKAVYDYVSTNYQNISSRVQYIENAPTTETYTYPTVKAVTDYFRVTLEQRLQNLDNIYVRDDKFDTYAKFYSPTVHNLTDVLRNGKYVLNNGEYYQGLLTEDTVFQLPDPTEDVYRIYITAGTNQGKYFRLTGTVVDYVTTWLDATAFNTAAEASAALTNYAITDARVLHNFPSDQLNQVEAFIHIKFPDPNSPITINWGANYWLDSQEIAVLDDADISIVWRYIPTVKTGEGDDDWGAWCVSSYDILKMS